MSEKKYTAEDFAVAEFAKRPNGGMAARLDPEDTLPWRVVNGRGLWSWFNDYDMAEEGWVPVPSPPAKPAITEADITDALTGVDAGFEGVVRDTLVACLEALGIPIVPAPKPTNADRLAEVLGGFYGVLYNAGINSNLNQRITLAKLLDAAGVTAPGGEE